MKCNKLIISFVLIYSVLLFKTVFATADGVSLENSSGMTLALEGGNGNIDFGNVNGFASNYGTLTGSTDLAMLINTSSILVNPANSNGNNNTGGALYIIGSNINNYAVRARLNIQSGTANIYMSGESGATLRIHYAKANTTWLSGTNLADGNHPLLTNSEVTLAGSGGFIQSVPLSNNETVELDLAAKILPEDLAGLKTQTIMFTAVAN